jgi:hypothetical protein
MLRRILRARGIIPVILIFAALMYWWLHPRAPKSISTGYVGERDVTLWNTLAQVREMVTVLHYGDRVEVLRQEGGAAQVRTANGATGWIMDARQLMDPALSDQSAKLLARARTMPVQARGQTKTVSNIRVEPGRNGQRIFQLPRGTPVVVLGRTVADAPQANEQNSTDEKAAGGAQQQAKKEDWLFVMRGDNPPLASNVPASETLSTKPESNSSAGPVSGGPGTAQPAATEESSKATPIAGWVLARFIEPDLPGPVRDYASSADLRVVAWFELNRVDDGSGGRTPQYLVAGTRGGEGQPCDFTMLRVYTWGKARKRYETAYVESDLCGSLPIQVSQSPSGPEFHFAEADQGASDRKYVMRQTVVRRVRNKPATVSSTRR